MFKHSDCHYRRDFKLLILLTITVFILTSSWVYLYMPGPTVFGDELLYRHNFFSIFEFRKYASILCPPGYPLALGPAIFFDNWYLAMGIMNAFWLSLLIPTTWFLAKTIELKQPLLAAIGVSCIPIHVIYSHHVLSESLFVTLFVLVVTFALRGGKTSYKEAFFFGVLLGFTHLTKYLFLPAIPLLLIFFYLSHSYPYNTDTTVRIKKLLVATLSYSFVLASWAIYAFESGYTFLEIFGFGLSGLRSETTELWSLIFWTTMYTAYLVLAWFPALIAIALWLSQITKSDLNKISNTTNKFHFFLLSILLIGGYWFLAIFHSFGATYNYPIPQYLLGRYLMQLTPIIIIMAVFAIEKLRRPLYLRSFSKAYMALLSLILAMLISWWILFRQGIWAIPAYFAKIRFNAVGIGDLDSASIFLTYLSSVMLVIIIAKYAPRFIGNTLIFLMGALFLQCTLTNVWEMKGAKVGIHAKELASIWDKSIKQSTPTLIILDIPWISEEGLGSGLEFFGIPKHAFLVKSQSKLIQYQELVKKYPQIFIVTKTLMNMKPLISYQVQNESFFINEINENTLINLLPKILSFGPSEIIEGESFNTQIDGKSALWMETSTLSSQGIIFWNEIPLETIHGENNISTAIIPTELTKNRSFVKLKLYDPLTHLTSTPVTLTIKAAEFKAERTN